MGLLDFVTNVASATVKTALTPIAVVKDAVDLVAGNQPDNTKTLLQSAANDAEEAVDELLP